jgi:hypothetical protein
LELRQLAESGCQGLFLLLSLLQLDFQELHLLAHVGEHGIQLRSAKGKFLNVVGNFRQLGFLAVAKSLQASKPGIHHRVAQGRQQSRLQR